MYNKHVISECERQLWRNFAQINTDAEHTHDTHTHTHLHTHIMHVPNMCAYTCRYAHTHTHTFAHTHNACTQHVCIHMQVAHMHTNALPCNCDASLHMLCAVSFAASYTHVHTCRQVLCLTAVTPALACCVLCPCSLIRRGVPSLAVRHAMHAITTLGCALCALPLAAGWATSPIAVTGWLAAFQSAYAFSFGGFHSYVQVGAPAIVWWAAACLHSEELCPPLGLCFWTMRLVLDQKYWTPCNLYMSVS